MTTPGDGLKAVVFDWDLTLWNSWDTHLHLLGQTADALGAPRPEGGEVAARYSMPFLQHLESFFPGNQQRVREAYMEFYRSIVSYMPKLYPGVVETLGRLKESGEIDAAALAAVRVLRGRFSNESPRFCLNTSSRSICTLLV